MQEGCVYVQSTGLGVKSWLLWSKSIDHRFKRFGWKEADLHKGDVEILTFNIYDEEQRDDKRSWLRKAYRCETCGLITLEEKYTLSNNIEKMTERKSESES